MGREAPSTQPSSVTSSGSIATIPIGAPRTGLKLMRLASSFTSGTGTSYTAEWSTDSTVADPTKTILKLTGGSQSSPLDQLAPYDSGFPYDDAHHDGNIYCKVTPNSGVNNAFKVAAYTEG